MDKIGYFQSRRPTIKKHVPAKVNEKNPPGKSTVNSENQLSGLMDIWLFKPLKKRRVLRGSAICLMDRKSLV
jgi:hypothetical protein